MPVIKFYRIRTAAPIVSVKEFSAYFCKEKEFLRLTDDSFLYLIVQRPILSFENLKCINHVITAEIRQKNSDITLQFKLPMKQSFIHESFKKGLNISVESDSELFDTEGNMQNIHSFKVYNGEIAHENFLKLFTPEWLIRDYYNSNIEMQVEGDITKFLEYKLHYIGTATEQHITSRLSSHSKLQKILSEEASISKEEMNSQELAIIFCEMQGVSESHLLYPGSSKEEQERLVDAIMKSKKGYDDHNDKEILKDAEKAFVSAIKPNYNTMLYKSYPKKEDLIYSEGLVGISYEFTDPFTLKFSNGDLASFNGDCIVIYENEKPHIIKFKNGI